MSKIREIDLHFCLELKEKLQKATQKNLIPKQGPQLCFETTMAFPSIQNKVLRQRNKPVFESVEKSVCFSIGQSNAFVVKNTEKFCCKKGDLGVN